MAVAMLVFLRRRTTGRCGPDSVIELITQYVIATGLLTRFVLLPLALVSRHT